MMSRTLARFLFVISFCASAVAGIAPGSISGYVKSTAGVPQMGATVELLGTTKSAVVYTDAKGFFSLRGVLPGKYLIKASAPSFIPTLREDVAVSAGSSKIINLTLNTLFEAVRMLPELKRNTNDDDDSWKWTLRSNANRPILRFDPNSAVVVETAQKDNSIKGTLAFMAGGSSEGYGSASDLGTAFDVQQSIFHTGTLGFSGDLGYGTGIPDGVIRASYKRQNSEGWTPEVAVTVRRFASPEMVAHRGALQAVAFSYSDGFSIGDLLDFQVGGEGQAIQFLGREANAFRPSAAVDLHLTPNTILEYRYATSEPNTRASKGFDSAPADLSETGPRMTTMDGGPLLENAHHHEISLSQRAGNNKVQVAFYHDRIKDAALLGVGNFNYDTGDVLPDVYSGTFSYNGGELQASGVRFVFQHRFSDILTGTVDYDYGGVLALTQPDVQWNGIHSSLEHGWRHSAALKMQGTIPRCHGRWIASYRWTSGEALTPVDLFNASAGQTDPYFNLFYRQPLPHVHGMPVNMEALIDIRNLLAQGYVPVIGPDGKTVYLMQAARSVRGGLAFTF